MSVQDGNVLSLSRRLLSFNTVNPPGGERECARFLAAQLEHAGFHTGLFEFSEERATLIARRDGRGGKSPICFTGHVDTVPLGSAPWSRDPFTGELDGDKLYGRGSSDMKAAVAAMAVMAGRLSRIKDLKAGVTLVLTAGEETCCEGARYVVSLDNVLGKAGAIVVGEPTSNHPWIGHKGCVRFAVRTAGTTAHASTPELGDNAIHKAAEVITKLRAFDFGVPAHPVLGSPTLNIGTISGGMNINSVPDQATLGIDIRTVPGQNDNEIRRALQRLLGDEVEIERLEGARSLETNPSHEWVQQVFDIMEPLLKQRPEPAGAAYFTDASVLAPAYGHPPVVIVGPGDPGMAHKTDEYCSLQKMEQAVEAYTRIAMQWCCD